MKLSLLFTSLIAAVLCSSLAFATPDVGSREYKIMLNPALFQGEGALLAVNTYWQELDGLIQHKVAGIKTKGSFRLKKQRSIRFYDTPSSCILKSHGYALRERIDKKKRSITLKYRSYDRFMAGHKNMQGEARLSPKTKFEEDIAPPFVAKYSYSTTLSLAKDKQIKQLNDPLHLYPGLASLHVNPQQKLAVVNGLTISEKVYKGAALKLGSVKAKLSLTLWYDNATSSAPVVAEISFKYKNAQEKYAEEDVVHAMAAYQIMQSMTHWNARSSMTKTAFVFSASSKPFCTP